MASKVGLLDPGPESCLANDPGIRNQNTPLALEDEHLPAQATERSAR